MMDLTPHEYKNLAFSPSWLLRTVSLHLTPGTYLLIHKARGKIKIEGMDVNGF